MKNKPIIKSRLKASQPDVYVLPKNQARSKKDAKSRNPVPWASREWGLQWIGRCFLSYIHS